MNNKVNSKSHYDVFYWEFFIALVCAALGYLFITLMTPSSDEVVLIFFILFLSYLYLVRLQRLFFTSLRKKQVATIRGYLLLASFDAALFNSTPGHIIRFDLFKQLA